MKRTTTLISITLLLVVSGCISVSTPPRERRPAFIVESIRPANLPAAEKASQPALRLRKFRAAEPYDSRRMYLLDERTGEIKALTSGSFAVNTAVSTSDATRRWLDASGLFSNVFDHAMMPPGAAATLEGWIDQACVVESDDGYKFSLKLTLWLTPSDSTPASPPQRFDYAETYSMTGIEPTEIAAAFGEALKQVLIQFETSLH